ncbi:MAG: YdeI/OmpD-associated family protein [Chloroflexota bacterium]|nr:YdeI/OmpD-associated family protein [Chloroflexota bacterium]
MTFFATPAAFRAWLRKQHEGASELWVGFHKKGSGKPSITWPESVDAALCFGWIDGVRRGIDEESYTIRFTPRKPTSTWSAVNIKRVTELTRAGLMQPAGLAAFAARSEAKSGIYAYEQRHMAKLNVEQERRFRANKRAWAFFEAQPLGYRRTATWWVVNAKRDDTRARRLDTLIEDSAHGRIIKPLTRPSASK